MVLSLGKDMGQGPTVLCTQRTQDSRNLCPIFFQDSLSILTLHALKF